MTMAPDRLEGSCGTAGGSQFITIDFDSWPSVACASALFIFGTLSTLITPALMQGWTDQFHWSESRLGWVAMIELAGLALGSVSAFFWQRRYNWRRVSQWSILVIVGANVSCAFTSNCSLLCLCRLTSGVAGGVLLGVYTAYLSNTRSPEKILAVTTFLQIMAQGALMATSSLLVGRWGMNGMYGLLACSVAILLPTLRFLPVGWPVSAFSSEDTSSAPGRTARFWIAGPLMLTAFVPFQIFQGGTFSFMQEFGPRAAGIGSVQSMNVVSLSAVGSALGPLAAYFLADRAGVFLPLVGAILLMLAVTVGLTSAPYSPAMLLLFLSALQATWLFAMCYLYAGLIQINTILTQAASPLSALSLAGGASLMGIAVEAQGLAGMFWLSLTCLILTAAAALSALYLAD